MLCRKSCGTGLSGGEWRRKLWESPLAPQKKRAARGVCWSTWGSVGQRPT